MIEQSVGVPALSVVVPMLNEEESVEPLVSAVRGALGTDFNWELLLIDDGSTDSTASVARELARMDQRIRLISLARNYGQTQAMQAGFDAALGQVVVTMDGDLQNDPQDIPLLLAKLEEGYDLVTGYRLRRRDALVSRKIPSWVANRLIGLVTGVRIRDNGCTLKAYRRSLLEHLHLYSDMHRFLPALATATAGARIAEVPVRHHPRQYGVSKYGLTRIAKLLADLLTMKMITSFREKPLRMFGIGAFGSAIVGTILFAAMLVRIDPALDGRLRGFVLPAAGLLWIALSAYLMLLGLVAEVALRQARDSESRALLPVGVKSL